MLPEIPQPDYAQALDAVVEEILSAAGVGGPPVDALAIVRAQGMLLAWDGRLAGRARYVPLRDARRRLTSPAILLRPEPREESRQWAIAHEIGEQWAGRVFRWLGIAPREAAPASRERVANQLAARLLLPSGWFAPDAQRLGWDVPALKRRYATASHELVARRLLDLPPAILITIFDQGQLSFRRGNRPGALPALSPLERHCWQQAHRLGQRWRACAAGWAVQAWAVHEPDWKREILRSEIEQE